VVVGGPGQHLDVGAGAEDLVEPTGDHHGTHFGMLEAQPLEGVVQLDVDPEVVGVELELVVLAQPALGIHLHGQSGDGRGDFEPPVAVAVGVAVESNHGCYSTTINRDVNKV
jgi:hypothetical protein